MSIEQAADKTAWVPGLEWLSAVLSVIAVLLVFGGLAWIAWGSWKSRSPWASPQPGTHDEGETVETHWISHADRRICTFVFFARNELERQAGDPNVRAAIPLLRPRASETDRKGHRPARGDAGHSGLRQCAVNTSDWTGSRIACSRKIMACTSPTASTICRKNLCGALRFAGSSSS